MAVYTDISDDELAAFLAEYDVGALRAYKGIAEGVENSNFLVVTDTGQFILTLYEKRVDPTDLPFFLGLMNHLAAKGFPCPKPVRKRSGEMLGEIAGRPSAMVSFLDGFSVRRPGNHHCRQLGRALARMHLDAAGFELERRNGLGLPDWAPLFAKSAERADQVEAGLHADIEAELAALSTHWPRDLPTGVIHADLFPDNVFFLKDELSGFIDFYFACNDILAYDLAVCINAWCFEPDLAFNATRARALIAGYREVRSLSQAEIAALPVLCRGAALRFLLTRLYDWLNVPENALVTPKDPREYIARLRFHRGIVQPGEYGIEPGGAGETA